MAELKTTGVVVPTAFPAKVYNRIHQVMNTSALGHPNSIKFSGAWNALSYRYAEADECAIQFSRHFSKHGGAPTSQRRYRQERTIFDFYSAAVSCLDTVTFAIFAIASLKHGANFPLANAADEAKVAPNTLLSKLQRNFPNDPISGAWGSLFVDQRNKNLRDIRNVLTHRVGPGRTHNVGGAVHGQTQWKLHGGVMTKNFLIPHRDDLTDLLCEVLPAIELFALQRS